MGGEAKQSQEIVGIVVGTKMNKTVRIKIERRVAHPAYGKIIKKTNVILAHDEHGNCSEGDIVAAIPTRPISKSKTWKVDRILESAR